MTVFKVPKKLEKSHPCWHVLFTIHNFNIVVISSFLVTIIFHVQKSFVYIYMGMGMPWMTLQSGLLHCAAESSKGLPIPLTLSFISCLTIQCLWIPYYTLAFQHWLHYFQKCWKFQVSKKFFKFILKHFFSNKFFLWKKMLNCQIIILLIIIIFETN
jgi:hypothetical protein